MNPQKVTAQQLFTMQCRYLVPLYQRQYVWNEKDQLQPLWEDVLTKTWELLHPSASGQMPRKHFLGAVVLRGLVSTGLEYQAFEVIDGQQRLTTLQLLLLALRDYASSQQFSTAMAMLTSMTENPPLNGREYERWKVVPTTRDRQDYNLIWAAHSPQQLLADCPPLVLPGRRRPEPRPRLVGAYEYFYHAIQQFVEHNHSAEVEQLTVATTPAERSQRIETLVRAITQQLELVRIDLDQDDDPQVIFETLNARGARLLPGDLVRNFLFLEATRCYPTQAEVEKLYATYWLQYDDTDSAAFWKAEVRQGRLVNQRFEYFLFHFLVSQLKRPDEFITLGYLYQAFIDWWRHDSGGDVAQVLALLQRYSAFYRRLIEPSSEANDRPALFGRRLRTLDTSTIYPLLLFLFVERGSETLPEIDGIVTDLESYLVRRLVCGLSTEGSNRLFQRMATDLRQLEVINQQVVQQYLLALNGPTAEWPTNEQFRHRWLTSRAYLNLTKPRIRMILEAVEWQQYTKYQENARPFLDSATIEHILPQNPNEADWPLAVGPGADEVVHEEARLHRADLLHSFGNLTLATQPLNSSLSNSAFVLKEKELSSQSTLMLNRYFTLHAVKHWDMETIITRGERLFEIADHIWPRPLAVELA